MKRTGQLESFNPPNGLFNEEHDMFRDAVRRFFSETLVPNIDDWEAAGRIPGSFMRACGEQGILCPQVPEAYGGPGGDYRFNAIVAEEFAYTTLGPGCIAVHSDIVAGYLLAHGNEEQKSKWLPRMVSGETIGAVAMTEPNTGSDLQAIRTTAIEDGENYIINGTKTFISNGQTAGLFVIVAKTDPTQGAKGISLFLVESDREGFSRGVNMRKLGLKNQDTSEIILEDIRVPKANMLGAEGTGFGALMTELPQERLSIAISSTAYARKAYELTSEYVKERQVFGKKVIDFQNTRFKLADMKTRITVAHAFVYRCLEQHVKGELTSEEGAMAKLWTTELQGDVVDECLQLFGGYGYMLEYPIARMYADARVQRIYGGTSEIMRNIIGRTV